MENCYIRNIKLECRYRYKRIGGRNYKTDEIDKLVLVIDYGPEITPFSKTLFTMAVDLMYLTEKECEFIKRKKEKIESNLRRKLIGMNVNTTKKNFFKQGYKVRLNPKTTKRIREIVIGISGVGVTPDKLNLMKAMFYNRHIIEKTLKKYDRPLVDVEILLQN